MKSPNPQITKLQHLYTEQKKGFNEKHTRYTKHKIGLESFMKWSLRLHRNGRKREQIYHTCDESPESAILQIFSKITNTRKGRIASSWHIYRYQQQQQQRRREVYSRGCHRGALAIAGKREGWKWGVEVNMR